MTSRLSALLIASITLLICLALTACGGGPPTPADSHAHQPGADAGRPIQAQDGHAAESGHGEDSHDQGGEEAHDHAEAHEDTIQLSAQALRDNAIRVEPVRRHRLAQTATFPARVSFDTERMAHVGTPVSGRVAEIRVRVGDRVQAGSTLFIIDSPALGEAQSEYIQRQTQVRVTRSLQEVALMAVERARRLHAEKAVSLGELQRREGEYQKALSDRQAVEASLTAAENKLRLWGMDDDGIRRLADSGRIDPHYAVRAPLVGQVVEREATLGEMVGPEREALLVLADTRRFWVLADVPEGQVHRVTIGSESWITLDARPESPIRGVVSFISPSVTPATRTVQVRVEVDAEPALKAGIFTQVQLVLQAAPGENSRLSLAVLAGSVQSVENRRSVFVEVPGQPGTFQTRRVETGPVVGGLAPILAGLKEGERVATGGVFVLKAHLEKALMEGKTCSGH